MKTIIDFALLSDTFFCHIVQTCSLFASHKYNYSQIHASAFDGIEKFNPQNKNNTELVGESEPNHRERYEMEMR